MRWLFLSLLLVSCVTSNAEVCGDIVCPRGKACDLKHEQHCVDPGQLESCRGAADDAPCTITVEGDGICDLEVCVPRGCGDGFVDIAAGEECDGDSVPDEADCTKLGYGFYVSQKPTCTPSCTLDPASCEDRSRCGDGDVQEEYQELCEGDMAPQIGTCIDYGFGHGYLGCRNCGPNVDRCDYFGWRSLLAAAPVFYADGKTEKNIVAVVSTPGGMYKLMRYDGVAWANVDLTACSPSVPATTSVSELFAVDNDVTFVTSTTHVIRLTGTTCQAWPANDLDGIWASSGTNAFVVNREGSNPTISRFDGTGLTTSYTATGGARLQGVWGRAANDVYAWLQPIGLVHFNGASWQAVPNLPASIGDIFAVWGDADNLYLGGRGPSGSVVVRRNNGSWQTILSDHPILRPSSVQDAVGVWRGTVWNGKPVIAAQLRTAWHVLAFDGNAWTSLESPLSSVASLWSIAGRLYGTGGLPRIAVFDGTARIDRLLDTSGFPLLAVRDGQNAYISIPGVLDSTLAIWNGAKWEEYVSAVDHPADIAVSSGNTLFAMAKSGDLLRWDSIIDAWEVVATGAVIAGNRMSAGSDNDVFTLTVDERNGGMYHWHHDPNAPGADPVLWPFPAMTSMWDLWAESPNNVFLAGDQGKVLRWNGASFMSTSTPITEQLVGIWGFSATEVYAMGRSDIVKYDGNSWSQLPTPPESFVAAWGRSNDMFVITNFGTLLHYDGMAWLPVDTGTTSVLGAVGGFSDSIFVADQAGGAHQIVRLQPWKK